MNLNAPIKKIIRVEKNEQDPAMYYLQETLIEYKDTYMFKVNGWRKIYHAYTQKQSRISYNHFTHNKLENKVSYQG